MINSGKKPLTVDENVILRLGTGWLILGLSTGWLILGLCMGWLVGLSNSPVTAGLLSGLIAILTLIFTALIKKEEKQRENEEKSSYNIYGITAFLTFLAMGIVAGSSLGIYAREHNLLINKEKIIQSEREIDFKYRQKTFDKVISFYETNKIADGDDFKKELFNKIFLHSLGFKVSDKSSVRDLSSNHNKAGLNNALLLLSSDDCDILREETAQSLKVMILEEGKFPELKNEIEPLKNSDDDSATATINELRNKHFIENCTEPKKSH